MSVPGTPEYAQVVVSILTPHDGMPGKVARLLTPELGPVEEEIGPLAFDYSTYYETEMGTGIRRWVWALSDLVDRSHLARIKLFTNKLEQTFSRDGKRTVNLDPGLLTLGNFVLATGKDNAHRIYLQQGIFADLTLIFRGGSYRPLEWTYPDYADLPMIQLLNRLRETYKWKLRPATDRKKP
ncbi:MAG: DUF4416 family protein [Desulfomonile tiedjei]|nr:DUF4416 family protein [Desulfomonile tiedjei]